MPGAQLPLPDHVRNFLRQPEHPQQVGHRRPAFAQAGRHLVLRVAALLHQRADSLRRVDGIQILPLQIFDQSDLHLPDDVQVLHDARHLFQARHPAGPVAAFPRDDPVPSSRGRDHDQRLQHALIPDALRQQADALLIKAFSGLIRIDIQFADRNLLQRRTFPVPGFRKQGVQPAAQAMRLSCHFSAFLLILSSGSGI